MLSDLNYLIDRVRHKQFLINSENYIKIHVTVVCLSFMSVHPVEYNVFQGGHLLPVDMHATS